MARQNSINANSSSPLLPIDGGSGLSSPVSGGILVSKGSAAFSPKVLTDGQILIGSTGLDPVATTITAGANISVTNAAGSITISASASAPVWVNQTASSVTMAINTGYVANSTSLITFTLPATANYGDFFEILGANTGLYKIAQAAGQQVVFGNLSTTVGVTGSIDSVLQGDCIFVRCISADGTRWMARSSQGNFDVV